MATTSIKELFSDLKSFEHIFEALPNGVVIVNTQGQIAYCNEELCRTFGYQKTELIGKSIEVLIPDNIKPHHPAYVKEYLGHSSKRPMGVGKDLQGLRKDGSTFPVEVGLNPFEINQHKYIISSVTDLTVRKELEEGFISVIEAAPVGMLIANLEGDIRHVNSQLCHIFGYQPADLIGQKVETLVPARYHDHHHQYRNEFKKNPRVKDMGLASDVTGRHAKGYELPLEIGLNPVQFQSEKAVIAVINDVSERKAREAELRQINAELDEFTYVASHDLKQPLRGINSLLEWIEEDLGPQILPEVKHNLDRAYLRITRMEKLVKDLLDYAKSGNAEVSVVETDLPAMIAELIQDLNAPEDFEIIADISIKGTKKLAVTPLQTVLRNLISNAIKHHDKAQGKVWISVTKKKNNYLFEVENDGPSIPAQSHERIFKLFQTLSNKSAERSGIGLAIVKRIVETQGGEISVTSNEQERGAKFSFTWPIYIRSDIHGKR